MQIFSQNENTSCVDFLQDKSTAVQYCYTAILESTFRGITVGLALAQPTRPWCQRKNQNTPMGVFFLAVILTAADRNYEIMHARSTPGTRIFSRFWIDILMNND